MTQCIIPYNYDRREILEIDYQRENFSLFYRGKTL